jgi:phage-related protein
MDFTYKGTSTSTYGVILNSLEWYKTPPRRADRIEVNGKDGATVVDNAYGALSLRCRITMTSTTNMSSVLAWLTGNGVLSFSEDSGKYRNAYVLDEVEFRRRGSIWEATFDFYCPDPYRYVSSEANTTITGNTATNLLTNSNFDDDVTDWGGGASVTRSVSGGILTQTATIINGNSNQNETLVVGRVYYLAVNSKNDTTSVSHRLYDGTNFIISLSTANADYAWYSGVGTATNTAGVVQIGRDGRASGWTAQYIKYVVLLDLTAIFGAGNEPTKAAMDTLFTNNYPLRWFDSNGTFLTSNSYTNAGTVSSLPLIKLTGTGTVSLTAGNTMSVALDTAYVHIDSDSREVYHLTTLKNRVASGDFPYLAVGANAITVTGTVTEVVITPRTRYL